MKVLFFILVVLVAPIMANADNISMEAKQGVSAKRTEMGYKSSERVGIEKAIVANRIAK